MSKFATLTAIACVIAMTSIAPVLAVDIAAPTQTLVDAPTAMPIDLSAIDPAQNNIAALLGLNRQQVHARFPILTPTELDLVMALISQARAMPRVASTDH